MSGRGRTCALKDDFLWLLDKMLDADGILMVSPIFENGVPGIVHTVCDRFGPSMDHGMVAMSPMWKIIDNDKFQWSKTILMDDDALARAHQIGINLANAAKDIPNAKWMGPAGVCPHCHTNNFYIEPGTTHAICGLCGMEGELAVRDGAIVIDYPEEQYAVAHDTMSGKMAHGKDIQENEGRLADLQKNSEEFKARKAKYKAFIQPTVPQKA